MADQPVAFSFTIDNFVITETRSRHEDTDYVSSTLMLQNADGTGTPKTITKAMGNLNNGTFPVALTFPNIVVSPGQSVQWSYSIVNAGNAPASKVESGLETVGNQLLSTEAKFIISGAVTAGSLLGLAGTAVASVVAIFATSLEGMLTANCDGPVAAEAHTFAYADLVTDTATGPFLNITHHPGQNSPSGCGENSSYFVNWHIDQGPYKFWGGSNIAPGKLNNGGPPVRQR